MEVVAVTGQARADLGKKSAKAAKREGMIPAVLYGGEEVIHFATTHKNVKDLVYTPQFKLAEITIDGKSYTCILKDIQFHPLTDEVIHLDFRELVEGTPVKVDVPLRFSGVSKGVKSGGKLMQKLRRLRIKTVPEQLVDHVLVDVTSLDMNQSIRVRDIQPGEGIEIMNSPGIPVATVEIPRALRSAASAAGKAGAAVEEEGEEGEEGSEEESGEE